MFILLDTDLKGMTPAYDYINELDDKPVSVLGDLPHYAPGGSFHIVDVIENPDTLTRWQQLHLASLGARIFTDKLTADSPVYAGPVPTEDKIRKIAVEGAFAEGRADYFSKFGVNYIGRANLDPRNIFVLDNKKGNPLHDPSKDETLEALYASLPEDWWGSCGFVSTGNVEKLEAFFTALPETIPLAFTTGAYSKLRFMGREYVDTGIPKNTERFGLDVRDQANRLSYRLSLTPEELKALDQ
jgi:hypothetical protein